MWGNIEPNRPDVKKIELSKIDFYLPKLERKLGALTLQGLSLRNTKVAELF